MVDKYPVLLHKFPITIELVSTLENTNIQILRTALKKIGNTTITNYDLQVMTLPLWVVYTFLNEYLRYMEDWETYFREELLNYCKKSTFSKIKWSTIKNSNAKYLFGDDITLEHLLWIHTNTQLDSSDNLKLITDVRDSILPWLNIEVWQKYKKSSEEKHENKDYYKQKKELLSGEINSINNEIFEEIKEL